MNKPPNAVIVCSLNDPAGTNIRERLISKFGFDETDGFFDNYPIYRIDNTILVCSHKDIVFVDDLEENFGNSRYFFISRHRAESGVPSLTTHFTGNFGKNDFGGRPGEISYHTPSLLKNYMIEISSLESMIPSAYQITIEATHHGPTSLRSPVLFVELGSTHEQWRDVRAAECVARALDLTIKSTKRFTRCALGIGGTHYSEKFNRILIESDVALGTIFPKYSLQYLDSTMLEQAISKSTEKITLASVDMKGLGSFRSKILELVQDAGLEILKA